MKKWNLLWIFALTLTGLALTGCASDGSSTADDEEEEVAEAEKPRLPIPPDSPFAKIEKDMGMQEVNALIGNPTSVSSYTTGKGFNPFYYGGDTHRTVAHYKGIGRITYTRDSRYSSTDHVHDIEYDPNEPGFERD